MSGPMSKIRNLLLLVCLSSAACAGGHSAEGNPVEPILPIITAVEPRDAAPGDRVTIRGTGLGGEGTVVTFDGVPARLIFATTNALLVVVPDVPEGDHSVVVTEAGTASAPFRYAVGPILVPTILAVEPASAHALDEITITGRNFRIGSQSANPSVRIGGVTTGLIGDATTSRMVVRVPILSAGVTTVQITSGAKASVEFPFEVLHSTPIVTDVSPNPARAGLRVTIAGRHLAGPGTVVLVDGISAKFLLPTSSTEIVATVPSVTPGRHTVQVRVEGEIAAPIALEVDDFDATGTYDVRSEVLSSRTDLVICPAVGTIREYPVELLDVRPELTLRIELGAPDLHGSVDASGEIRASRFACNPLVCGFDPVDWVGGLVERREGDARYTIDATIVRQVPCSLREHVTGVRR